MILLKLSLACFFCFLCNGMIIFAIIGLPKPGSIVRADHVPRIPWSAVYDNFKVTKNFIEGSLFVDWMPDGKGIYLLSKSGFLQRRLSGQMSPVAKPVALEAAPDAATEIFVNPDRDKNYLIISLDDQGDEQFQLYRYDLRDHSLKMLSQGQGKNIGVCFTAGGKKFLYAHNEINSDCFDFYLIDPDNPGSSKRIYTTDKPAQYPVAFSPISDDRLLVVDWRIWTAKRLYILDISSGEITPLDPEQTRRINHGTDYSGAAAPAVWSKDGTSIYYLSDKFSEFQQLYQFDVRNRQSTIIVDQVQGDIVELHITSDRAKIVYKTLEAGQTRLYVLDLDSHRSRQLPLPWGFIQDIKMHPCRNEVALNLHQTFFQADLISYDLETDKLRYWYQKERNLIKPDSIYYRTTGTKNGEPLEIQAYVFKPTSAPKPYPVLINLHGGPVNHSSFLFFDLYQSIFELGVVIISPNFRGSLGFGKSFELADNGYNRTLAVQDIGALLDWIKTQPDLDASRIGVIGASYGGYMALSTLVRYSSQITCGIDAFGVSNLVTLLENSLDIHRDVRRSEAGNERRPAMRTFLNDIAPVNQAEHISVPLFIYQGLKDTQVPPSESEQIVKAVRDQGLEVWYVVAENEGHGLSHPLNALFITNAYFQFIEKYLV
ncbi:S9 family peptidase [candidate division CSSED10-310 bacterium]|uniref:S9 family peptidase n=1 Tax=candidate division CSSED10-310 bacterium TaxID=2855610 RepID=A0ABV6Z2G2_UNCC1